MTSDRNAIQARQQEMLVALDAIHARVERGEITAAEGDALHKAELERLELELQLLRALQPPRRHVGAGLRLAIGLLAIAAFHAVVYYFFVR